MIHACGMVDLVTDLAYSPDVVAKARAALLAGAPVLCDAQMVASGVTRKRLPADNEVLCTLARPARARRWPADSAPPAARPRWSCGVTGSRGAVVAIGNAPTALFRLLELLDAGAPRPGRDPRAAGGFRRRRRVQSGPCRVPAGVPYLVVHGRRGGSAMAVAAVNAIASEAE